MIEEDKIHEGDIGTHIQVEIWDKTEDKAVDISAATSKKIIFKYQDGIRKEFDAVFPTGGDGSNGIMEYISKENDLKPAGILQIQACITLSSGQWKTETIQIIIQPNI